jgi:hypothetical protein
MPEHDLPLDSSVANALSDLGCDARAGVNPAEKLFADALG